MVHNSKDYINIVIVVFIASLVALAGAQNGLQYKGFPILVICMAASFLIHWLAFIPSYLCRTEKFYDILGSIAYLTVLFIASYFTYLVSDTNLQQRSLLAIALVSAWTLRLGLFLFLRIMKAGEDRRFREVKKSFSKFLLWWSMSALWVFLTAVNALTMIINNDSLNSDTFLYLGLSVWIIGFAFEVIADEQKRRFNSDSKNNTKFISTGLWSLSRHPNYFGEILVWIGMAIIAFPTLSGLQYVTLISPVFVLLLLTRVSGVNLLEDRAEKKWGTLEGYKKYKRKTPPLVPFI
tara:strand:+ start:689 stop:1567 length:879 start_codon:yes stop_codon:yes gene_type:complete